MEAIIRQLVHDLASPLALIYPDWNAVVDDPNPSACTVKPAAMASAPRSSKSNRTPPSAPSFSSAAPPSTMNVPGPPSTLNQGALFGPSNVSEGTSGPPVSASTRTTKRSRTLLGWRTQRPRSALTGILLRLLLHVGIPQRLGQRQTDFLARLPQCAADLDCTGPNRLTKPDIIGINLIQACGYTPTEPSTLDVGFDGLVPPSSSHLAPISPVPFTGHDFGDFRRRGPRHDMSGPRYLQDSPTEPPCSASAGQSYVQDPAAEPPCSASAGQRYVQDPVTEPPCSASAGKRYVQDRPPNCLAALPPVHSTSKTRPANHVAPLPPSHATSKTRPPNRLVALPLAHSTFKT